MFSARLFLVFHTHKDLLSTHVRSAVCACACMRSVCVHMRTVMHGLMAIAQKCLIHIMQHATTHIPCNARASL